MEKSVNNYASIKIARFLMAVIGMWPSETKRQKYISDLNLMFWIITVIIAAGVEGVELYFSLDDLYAIANIIPITSLVYRKFLILIFFLYYRKEFLDFNYFTMVTFWKKKYNSTDFKILDKWDKIRLSACLSFSFLVQTITWHYVLSPVFESWNKNVSERVLRFELYFDILPYYETPYYECISMIEAVSAIGVALITMTDTIFLFTINSNVAAQFEILQKRLENICNITSETYNIVTNTETNNYIEYQVYYNLKDCIQQHQLLIQYIAKVDDLYRYVIMYSLIGFMMQICFSGFQILMGDKSKQPPIISFEFLIASFIELYICTWSSHQILLNSLSIHSAIYRSKWYNLLYTRKGKEIRIALNIVMMRASCPCILNVGKFFPLTINTFASVIKTSVSYFTVLRKLQENNNF